MLSPRAGPFFFKQKHVFEKVRCREATWAELEPTWEPKSLQKGAQEGAKTSPRGSQDGAKKEKKNEVKLREVKSAKTGIEVKEWQVVTRPLGE